MKRLPDELLPVVAKAAALRREYHRAHGTVDRLAELEQCPHVLGAFGEYAVAWELGLPVNNPAGGPDRGAPDVGPWQVKAVRNRHHGLLVRMDRAGTYQADTPFILVYCESPWYRIQGWALGGDFLGVPHHEAPKMPQPCYRLVRWELRPWPPTETKGT